MLRILVADADPHSARALREAATHPDRVDAVTDHAALRTALRESAPDVLLLDLELPGLPPTSPDTEPAAAALQLAQRLAPGCQCILLATFGTVADAVIAMQHGASDFLCKPVATEQLRLAVDRAGERASLVRENRSLRRALDERLTPEGFVSSDPRVHRVFKTLHAVADSRSTVLITGESGTGKTLLARALHAASNRADHPFIEINCGALPENLLESELFGHVKGAFTGAIGDRAGKFEAADGGTLFLDEIGTATPALQIKLLRVLQDRVLERVGGTRSIEVDVRVVLATNVDLAEEVRAGRFREDLYYRVHVVAVDLPPLRARPDDVMPLAEHFLSRFREELGKPLTGFSPATEELLRRAPWPGNVRQLENVMERAVLLSEGPRIEPRDLPAEIGEPLRNTASGGPGVQSLIGLDVGDNDQPLWLQPLRSALEAAERKLLERALEHFAGNRSATARSLGINRSTLFNKLRRHGLQDGPSKTPL